MIRVTKIGKVMSYDPATGRVVCYGDPRVYFWRGGTVKVSGSRSGTCHSTMKTFEVTISPETAAQLVRDFELSIEYDDRQNTSIERVLKFAGEAIASN